MGFRADAAYKIPGEFWGRLIGEAKSLETQAQFFAETLGCRLEECSQLSTSGFDFLYNSSKWWDYQEPWCLDQYNTFRHLAPSVSFPESHDTERLAVASGGAPEVARQRYLFAAYFSTGVMLPIGYEYGFKNRLNVVQTSPQDWETPTYDLTPFIKGVNRMKKTCPVLLEEGPQVRVNPGGGARGAPAQVPAKPQGPGSGGDQRHRGPPTGGHSRPNRIAGAAAPGLAGPDPRHHPVEIVSRPGIHPASVQDAPSV
jgi:starch synthase (maltosyl-transferring)